MASHSDSSGLSVWRLVQGGASVMRVLLLALNEKEESRFWGLQLFLLQTFLGFGLFAIVLCRRQFT